ncbi:MAG: SUMF1/EgtB/PvdO family nonheme iron enzyme [Candidatus Alcyoniella australis]|nr:SUMF1/EgtB/PvdO family nonheme iron enzyme [Candidatus Alcyoniella australis]
MTITCTQCHAANFDTAKQCRRCKSALPKLCPACGFQGVLQAIFCSRCGHLFQDEIEKSLGSKKESPEGIPQTKSRYDPKKFAPRKRTIVSCPECGRKVSNEAKFCPGCGHLFKQQPPEKIEPPAELKAKVEAKAKAQAAEQAKDKARRAAQPKAAKPKSEVKVEPTADVKPLPRPVSKPLDKPRPVPQPLRPAAAKPAAQPVERPAAKPVEIRQPQQPPPIVAPPPDGLKVPAGMVYVPGGKLSRNAQGKALQVAPFLIDYEPVTYERYREFLTATNHRIPEDWLDRDRFLSGKDRCPVVWISMDDVSAYLAWSGKRLLTQAEWELAAAGSDGRTYPWGDQFRSGRCNSLETGRGTVTPVDAFPEGRSPYGCLDMVGNVSEWIKPTVGNDGGPFMFKGGSYVLSSQLVTVNALLVVDNESFKTFCLGFRCAKDAR